MTGEERMKYVLFVCAQNAGRSQMAQALFARHAPADIRAESAGARPRREGIWPNVIEAMREVGVDLAPRSPRKLTVEMQLHADWAITLACGAECPFVPGAVEDWDIDDPAGKSLDEVRAIRDDIEARVKRFVDERTELIRADRTAHQRRLEQLLPWLAEEFLGEHSEAAIRRCADEVLCDYEHVPVRSFVLTLAHRRARRRLRGERSEVLARA